MALRCIPRAVDNGDHIAVFPFPKAKKALMELGIEEAVYLRQQLDTLLNERDAEIRNQERALLGMLTSLMETAAKEIPRGKRPWEIKRTVWMASHAPLRWAHGLDTDDRPRCLDGLDSIMGHSRVRIVMELRKRFCDRMGYSHCTATADSITKVNERHEIHVARALAQGLPVPHWVMADYPSAFWETNATDLSWVVYHLDPARFLGKLLQRAVRQSEVVRMREQAEAEYRQRRERNPAISDVSPGQFLVNWTPQQVRELLKAP